MLLGLPLYCLVTVQLLVVPSGIAHKKPRVKLTRAYSQVLHFLLLLFFSCCFCLFLIISLLFMFLTFFSFSFSCYFVSWSANVAFGGWGGAVFVTNALPHISIHRSQFYNNLAFSSYTFSSQGGAVMASHQSQVNITETRFVNNTAATLTALVPNTFSGSGGALFVETTILYMSGCFLIANKAVSGQFDDGANGGGLLLENVAVAIIEDVLFQYNSAEGYDGYSSYASSGSGGAISFKFATASIRYSHFYGNWVSVGGTHMSAGGAISVYFAYTPSSAYDIVVTPVVIYNCTFIANVAYAQLCR